MKKNGIWNVKEWPID